MRAGGAGWGDGRDTRSQSVRHVLKERTIGRYSVTWKGGRCPADKEERDDGTRGEKEGGQRGVKMHAVVVSK